MKFLPLILKNVLRKRTRTLLTVGSIVLPLLVICLMGTFLQALDRPDPGATRGMFRLVTRHKVGLTSLIPVTYADKLSQLDGAVAVTKFNWFGGQYVDSSAKNFFARFAVEPETFLKVFDDATIVQGSAADWLADRAGCVVAVSLAERYGWKLGDKVVLKGDIFPINVELTIRGIYEPPGGNGPALFFNRKYLEEALPWFKGLAGTVWVKARDAAAATRLSDEIDRMFENSSYPTKTETEKAFQMGFVQMFGNVKLLVTGIASVIVFVILLISANTMAMTARERITEIAVLRTLGFQKGTVLRLILGESLAIGVTGGVLGIAFFAAMLPGLKKGLLNSPMAPFSAAMGLFPDVLGFAFFISILIGLTAGIFPALHASQRPITDGLRQVG